MAHRDSTWLATTNSPAPALCSRAAFGHIQTGFTRLCTSHLHSVNTVLKAAFLMEGTPQVEQQIMQPDSQPRTTGPEVTVPSLPSVTDGPGSSWLSVFRALSPPAYIGTESAVRTEEWLDTIQELLAGIRCPNNMAVTLMVTLLELHAKRWWKSLMGSTFRGRVYTDISWSEFSEAFLEHFIPSAARDGLEERFLQLKQGSMSVTEYQREFQHLARFADSYELDDRG
ncbi:hypothetical protein KSP39_PZI017967 [Platanthera zijinensis]|uniref:Retrotransposon gag domain-containing protein n=1 Tax=Platanthera zijinensis TaxID=2320716 RepID=A0AAP0B5P1_9ASPA